MNEDSTFTLYDLIILIYKSKLTVLVYGIISALVSIFIITFWAGEHKYSIGYYATPTTGIKVHAGSEINEILSSDGFDKAYFFKEFYANLQSVENFQNNLNNIKNDLISLYPEFKSEKLKDIRSVYSQFNFEYQTAKDYDVENIFASSFTNFSNIEANTFILQNHIESSFLLSLDNLNIYYKQQKIDAIKRIGNLREKHKSNIKDQIDREIYIRDTRLEQILNEFDNDVVYIEDEISREIYIRDTRLEQLLNEFDKDVAYIEEDISVAKLMGYKDPVIEFTAKFPSANVSATIPGYLYGVKILEKKLENLLFNKNIMIQNKIIEHQISVKVLEKKLEDILFNKDMMTQNKLIEHQIKIDNYSKTSSDAFISDMNSFKDRLKKIESTLTWIENNSNKSNIFFNYNKDDLSIKRISRSNHTAVLISLVLGMFLGFFVYMFRIEKSNRNDDIS
tara:strand:+ start:358 stop:1707 length:1350 start_codon:yes stop_codon:yes gene_type:complete